VHLAVEPRFKAAVLMRGGFLMQHSAPEVDTLNFASRVQTPVLMLNGRFDFIYPIETAQLPMFRLFGAPDAQKRRVTYDTSHNIPRQEMIRETLDWLDRHMGPMQR
jgi:eukaryotic-like serine/threonine-protein kinase